MSFLALTGHTPLLVTLEESAEERLQAKPSS